MTDFILHHFDRSPFSEKVRLAFGLKKLAWRSVEVPRIMPKPDLMPLTGSYRRTPVLQIGADVYCDTPLILREIERRHPLPGLFPSGSEGLASAVSWWAEKTMFVTAVSLAASLMDFPSEWVEDRKAFIDRDFSRTRMLEEQALNRRRLAAHMTWLASMLKDGRPFLLGAAPSAADLSAFHPIWFVRRNGGAAAEAMLPILPLAGWMDRVAALGHGERREFDANEALDTALAAAPMTPTPDVCGAVGADLSPGRQVVVRADDSGRDPIVGTLVAADAEEVVIRRNDPRVGDINMHFPMAGFDVVPA